MHFDKIHNKGQVQLFKNQYLEYLTKTHPLIIWGMYMPVLILLPYYSLNTLGFSTWTVVGLFLAGMFSGHSLSTSFTGSLFILLLKRRSRKIVYIMHGNHHHYPRDKERLFMPPVPSLIIASILFLLMYLPLGKNVFPFFPGFMLGYLIYGSMHYAIHAWNPPFKWMKGLWRNHHLHHYKNEDMGFGVSSTLWDHVLVPCSI